MNWLMENAGNVGKGIASSFLILATVVLVVRLAGVRTFAKMTSFDFAVTVATGSIMGSTATGSTTVLQGAVAVSALVTFQAINALLKKRSPRAKKIISNRPLLIMRGREVLQENLEHVRMDEDELASKLREANVTDLGQVRAVVLEPTGDVSVLHSADPNAGMDEQIMRGVRTKP